MIAYEMDSIQDAVGSLLDAAVQITSYRGAIVETASFTTSPVEGAVASQYASYLNGAPGSLFEATKVLSENIRWFHGSLSDFGAALERQESRKALSFVAGIVFEEAAVALEALKTDERPDKPITDLTYAAPAALVEAGTPLKELKAMFIGDDSSIIAAADMWTESGRKMTRTVEFLEKASATLAAGTDGPAFDVSRSVIDSIVSQGTAVAANATAMGTAMLELPPIRTAALAQLAAMEAEVEAELAVVSASSGAAATMAVLARTCTQVESFVSSYLQSTLDAARPTVTNLGVSVTGHYGGGTLQTGSPESVVYNDRVGTVAGGATAPSSVSAVQQSGGNATAAGQVAAAPASGGSTGAVPDERTRGYGAAARAGNPVSAGRVQQPLLARGTGAGMYLPVGGGVGAPGGTSRTGGVGGTGGPGSGAGGGAGTGPRGVPGTGAGGAGGVGGGAAGSATPHSFVGTGAGGAGSSAGARGGTVAGPAGTGARGGSGRRAGGRSLFGRNRKENGVLDYFRRQLLGEKPTTVKRIIR